jgi:hypothetical protein
MLPPSSQEKMLVQAVACTTLPACSVIETSGANADDPDHTPVGAIAIVASREAIVDMVLTDFEQ